MALPRGSLQRRGKARSRMYGFWSNGGMTFADCGQEPEVYLVDDRLWAKAGIDPWGGLCLHCLSKRLERPLQDKDFVHANIPDTDVPWLDIEPGISP